MGDDATRETLKKQLEFYFSDSNLRRDRFLQRNMDKEGYAVFATICSFNKMKSISTDLALAKAAVEASEFIELNGDGTKIRRKDKLVNPPRAVDFDERNVYVENIPEKITHDSVRQMFQACGKVLNVSLPRHKDTRKFKGFAFIEFATKAGPAKAIDKNLYSEQNPKALRVISKTAWLKMKGLFKDTKAVSCSRPKDYKEEATIAATFQKGCLLRATGIGANASRRDIKDTVAMASEGVRFVDYFPQDGKPTDTAIIRFKDCSDADQALKYFGENPTKLGDSAAAAVFAKLPEEEEATYFQALAAKQTGSRRTGQRGKRFRKNKKGGGREKRSRDSPKEDEKAEAAAAPAKRAKAE